MMQRLTITVEEAAAMLGVKGQWFLPTGGHWNCPLVATGIAR